MEIKVTICELPDSRDELSAAWSQLEKHVATESSDLLILNEAPFDTWFARNNRFDEGQWNSTVASHTKAINLLDQLGCSVVATAPVNFGRLRHNQAFTWNPLDGCLWWRRKAHIPDEEPVYEATWYHAAPDPPDVRTVAKARMGVLTCTEIWRMDWASQLGQLGAQIIATPRATGDDSLDKWFAAGRVSAICSGAYSVSSNRSGDGFGGGGWIFSPDGELLGKTHPEAPAVTVALDLAIADEAKSTYPRYAVWDPV